MWVKHPGLPPITLDFTTPALNQSSDLADEYIKLGGASSPDNYADYFDFYSRLRVVFLSRLDARISDVSLDIIKRVDGDYNVTNTEDPECRRVWVPFGIRKGYQPAMPVAKEVVSTVGRLKYLTPIYQALLDSNQRDLAVQWFEENIDFYHPIAVVTLKRLLGLHAASNQHQRASLAPTSNPVDALIQTVQVIN